MEISHLTWSVFLLFLAITSIGSTRVRRGQNNQNEIPERRQRRLGVDNLLGIPSGKRSGQNNPQYLEEVLIKPQPQFDVDQLLSRQLMDKTSLKDLVRQIGALQRDIEVLGDGVVIEGDWDLPNDSFF